MKLTRDQVLHVAALARLGLKEEEIAKFQMQLSGILEYVGMLNEVNTDGIELTSQVTGLENIMREDISAPSMLADPADMLKCSPLPIEKNQIKVKNVFE